MKNSASLSLTLSLIILLTPVIGLSQTTDECARVKQDIQQLEQLDLNDLAPSVRQLYKESLLKLYTKLDECLDSEISRTSESQAERLALLTKEKSDNRGKITILRIALNLPDVATSRPDVNEQPTVVEHVTRPNAPTKRPASEATTSVLFVKPSALRLNGTLTPSNGSEPAHAAPADCSAPASYDDAPGLLTDLANGLAADIITQNNPDIAAQAGPQMVLYTVFDAASPKSSELVRNLESYHYIGETARTDKQLGGSANADGAVSGVEKPGFAQLLGFAVEHGGITKKNDGTNLTLSTSLYSLYAAKNKDTAENYAKAGILNRVGLAATFAVDNKTNDLANARRNNLSEWSARIRLFGDRSTRSPGFRKVFDEKVRPLIRERLRTLGRSIDELATKNPKYGTLENNVLDTLPAEVTARMACPAYTSASPADKQKMLAAVILGRLRSQVFVPVSNHSFELGADEIARIEGEFLPNLKRSLDNLVVANKIINDAFADLQKGPLATFAYTNHRIPTGSDYSEAKFLFDQEKGFMGPLKLTGNMGLSLYNKPDPALNQRRLRDFAAALSFEGSSDSPFTEGENKSKVTYAFVGRYQRLFENRNVATRTPDIGSLQFVTEVPLFRGLSIPFSITYSSATEEEKKQGFRFNFGTRFDMDKLVELLRANAK
ncbi:MAG: hypothetical protein M3539_09800 [Acidobacteriota bacterium]|nr:hypothetical protein [Acidobacteriota bacterium]